MTIGEASAHGGSPSVGKDAPVKGPEEEMEEQLLGSELLLDQNPEGQVTRHVDCV